MLIDNHSDHARFRLAFISLLVLAAGVVLLQRLYVVQLSEGEMHTASLRSQTITTISLSPARGSILDRNGLALAENKASIDIDIYLRELVGHYARNQKGVLPTTNVTRGSRTTKRIDIAKIVKDSTSPITQALGLKELDEKELIDHYDQHPQIPYHLANNLDFAVLSQFAEHSAEIPGIQETARPVRNYNYGALAAQILGYTGMVENVQEDVFVPESVGKEGIERTFDSYLQGTPGSRLLRKNNLGYILGVEAETPPVIGNSVYLTIDARIQYIAEQAMRNHGIGRGGVVVMDPNTGDVLAMVSIPSFDPNDFVPAVSASTWSALTQDPTKPLLNRTITAGYPTGSTFKPITAIAALTNPAAKFTPNTVINSPSAIYWANRWWKDWTGNTAGEGNITLKTALEWSTNTFFYQLGVRAGIDSMEKTAKEMGLGARVLEYEPGKVFLPGEIPGVIPGKDYFNKLGDPKVAAWKAKRAANPKDRTPPPIIERWSDGHTMNTSIGQGFVSATPIQMATMTSAIANGGTVHLPRMVAAVTRSNGNGQELVQEFPVRTLDKLDIKPEYMEAVRQGMLAVVESGTARKAQVEGVKVAGKTGTAQFMGRIGGRTMKDLRTWFIGFAPYDKPRYAIAMVIEGGVAGGRTNAPVVSEILTGIFSLEKGTPLEMAYMAPAQGHFLGATEPEAVPVGPNGEPIPAGADPSAIEPEDTEGNNRKPNFFERIFGTKKKRG